MRRVHTPGYIRRPYAERFKKIFFMKEYVEEDFGMETLSEKELQISGGMSLKEVWRLLQEAAALADELEKYWPRFRKGFQAGWRSA